MPLKLAKMDDKPEIFFTIQGEGINTGKPAVFARSSLCNLQCFWCDTDYTWNWEGTPFNHRSDNAFERIKYRKEEQIIEMTADEVVESIGRYDCQHLVITGGEPMMQQEAWVEVMNLLRILDPNYYFEVETNGTLLPTPEFDRFIDQYNVSPKLENSRVRQAIREKPEVYEFFANSEKAWFKFVVGNAIDSAEVMRLIQEYKIPREKIILMPLASEEEALNLTSDWLVEQCKLMNVRFSDRLHIRLFSGKRGT